ncbi:hypothetical protein F5Y19DRAFT_479940 [Xylariaceae sp. FL1651]|nr:hypothetical protein F5Y19DRAFT_479940 [Xylariaceae sp. FL1651]
MTRDSLRVSDDNTRRPPRSSRPTSQQSHRLHSPHSQSSPQSHARSKPRSPHSSNTNHPQKPLHKSSGHSQTHGPSPLKMVTTTTPSHPSAADDAQYYFLPDVNEPNEELRGHAWMEPTVIDDEDLIRRTPWSPKSTAASPSLTHARSTPPSLSPTQTTSPPSPPSQPSHPVEYEKYVKQ